MSAALKEMSETEPNNDFAAPQAIPMNVTVTGVADNEDVDYFVVDAKKGQRITAEESRTCGWGSASLIRASPS